VLFELLKKASKSSIMALIHFLELLVFDMGWCLFF